MNKVYYKKTKKINKKLLIRLFGVVLTFIGLAMFLYIFTPIIIWQFTLSPAFASEKIAIPIPQYSLLTPGSIQSLLSSQVQALGGGNLDDARNWFPSYIYKTMNARIASYAISIPRLGIANAIVSTRDTDLGQHLVNVPGTPVPPDKGNTVIEGHSTLPALYQPGNYHTIFANVHQLQIGDEILVNVANITYTYKIFSITIVDPTDTSPLDQTFDDSYLTIITCTPPGTVWKRLIIKSRIEQL